MAADTDGIHSSVKAIQDMEAACARFSRALVERLPEIERELRQTTEALEERRSDLRREIASLQDRISSADEDDDVSWESHRAEEAEDEMASVQRCIRSLAEVSAAYTEQARNAEHLANSHSIRAREFLNGAADDLKAYLANTGQDGNPFAFNRDLPGAPTFDASTMREKIRNAQYKSADLLNGGINTTFILKNGVRVIFKPSNGEHPSPPGIPQNTQYRREKAASLVDELLGLGLVPPTEIITAEGSVGSAQLFKEGFETAHRLEKKRIITMPSFIKQLTDRQRQDWQLLDELIGNMDRHNRNWMLNPRPKGVFDLALIDNGLSFNELGRTRLQNKPASQERLDEVNRARLERFLATEMEWRTNLSDLVGDTAVDHLITRAREMLSRNHYE